MDQLDRLSTGAKAWILLFLITVGAAAPGVFAIPSLDRDESRFAQASKQMLETGDFILIRYQDELRNKKPAGIHWLQAGSTAAFSSAEANAIWSYRIPSWIGAGLATLACFWTGIALLGRRAAFLGAALFGATFLLTSEAHISKTDAVLIFFTTLAAGALARLYMRGDNDKRMALLFWAAMGLGFLIKGPVTPMVAGFILAGLWLLDGREARWMRSLIWWPGLALFVLMVLPWFTWVQLASDGAYLEGAVGKDLRDKLVTASEGHGGLPGYHLAHLPLLFFPATLFLIPSIMMVYHALKRDSLDTVAGEPRAGLRFLLVWAVPTWLFFEFLPTKLSHYILPAYPALALLAGYGALKLIEGVRAPAARIASLFLFALGAGLIAAISFPGIDEVLMAEAAGDFTTVPASAVMAAWAPELDYPLWLWIGGVGAAALTLALALARRVGASLALAIAASVLLGWHARAVFLPSQLWIQPTEAARFALEDVCGVPGRGAGCEAPDRVQAVGYSEPSFVMVLGTQNPHPPETVIDLPEAADAYPVAYLINLEDPAGPAALAELGELAEARAAAGLMLCERRSEPRYALNYSNGDPVHFIAVRYDAGPCAPPPSARQMGGDEVRAALGEGALER